ncbi:MAG: LuxR C-terminal-related transcriptional regulator [Emergencia sp.]
MKHIIVFCYIFTILIGVTALTIQWLAGKGDKARNFSIMKPFIAMLLVMNVYDFLIYYSDNIISDTIIDLSQTNLLISFGDCLIAFLVLMWLKVQDNFQGPEESESRAFRIGKKYVIFYLVIWLVSVIFFVDIKWLRLVIDLPLMLLLIGGGIHNITRGRRSGEPAGLLIYKGVITVFMAVNYISYFSSESGILGGTSDNIMDLTIFYWLVINAANCILLYRRDFAESYLGEAPAQINLDEALDMVRKKYDLTKREVEILKEVYDGKTNTQIAEALFISESTVKAHIYNLFRKLGVKSRVEAVCIVRDEKEK